MITFFTFYHFIVNE